ncbi:MAG: phage portal protein, partial [Clostridia bacterium]|nr:phage portal protein [Clostridia bacterium]
KLLEQYITSSESGKPWMIPSENFAVETVKPLSLTDLAIVDSIKLDKRTAASIIGVPPFIVGEGSFNADEYNNFVQTKLLPIVTTIEQEMTRKLIVSPKWFFAFNPRSLYSYSLTELAEVSCNLVDRAIIDRNEARNWIGCDPREGLSELAILENYIPYSKIGDQNKLKGGTSDGKTD